MLRRFYSSPNIIWAIKSRRLREVGHVACVGESRGAYRVLGGKPEERRSLGRPRLRWEDSISSVKLKTLPLLQRGPHAP